MKKSLLFGLFMMLSSLAFAQVTYVNQAATGANNGSSWTDAFSTLDAALNSSPTEIWIASGTYVPGEGAGDTSSTFVVLNDVSIIGGFSGSETSADQSDPVANPTILSGDINGDDIDGDLAANRTDNTRHVMVISQGLAGVSLTGLTVSGGHTSDDLDRDFFDRAGGGVFCGSNLTLLNCTFSSNFAGSGGGVCVLGDRDINAVVVQCQFTGNQSLFQGGGLLLNTLNEATVQACTFSANQNNRGALYPLYTNKVTISDCIISDNINQTGFGGGMFSWQNIEMNVIDCEFRNNIATNAAGGYIDSREVQDTSMAITFSGCVFDGNEVIGDGFGGGLTFWQGKGIMIDDCQFRRNTSGNGGGINYNGGETVSKDRSNMMVTNTIFENNETTDFGGGAMYLSQASFTVDECTFNSNFGTNGSHIFNTGADKNYLIQNSSFALGNAQFGGATTNYGANSKGNYYNCEFLLNNASTSGGSMIIGFLCDVEIDSCRFSTNTANFGGAIYAQNDSTRVKINQSFFEGNACTNSGGAVNLAAAITSSIENSVLIGNEANFGGAISLFSDTMLTVANYSIANSIISANTATAQGGAINVNNISGSITNTVISSNEAEGVGTGGAISFNSSDQVNHSSLLMNNTFFGNTGVLAFGISAFTANEATMDITFQNNIFDEINTMVVEDGTPTFISNGGNLVTSDVINDLLNNQDYPSESPSWVDPTEGNFYLQFNSPCIDNGVTTNAPTTDLEGRARVNAPDIGAFEFDPAVNVEELKFESFAINPNPATNYINISEVDEDQMNLVITDMRGRIALRTQWTKGENINVSSLSPGTYTAILLGVKQSKVAKFLKL